MDRNAEGRRNAFKSKGVFKPEELRRRREAQQVEIRKQKREENLTKRRNFNPTEFSEDSDDDVDIDNADNQVRTQRQTFFQTVPSCMVLNLCN